MQTDAFLVQISKAEDEFYTKMKTLLGPYEVVFGNKLGWSAKIRRFSFSIVKYLLMGVTDFGTNKDYQGEDIQI
ncbi:MAG: hypothetical protein GY869_11035, partial [Planctomycetes bacterium]|nr:hypothetical protein [Planctomycetota bacterium]